MTAPTPDEAAIAYAHQLFDLARAGGTADLMAAVDAGVPVNLTNAKGDTLLILAAYHEHAETVRELVARGADVHRLNDRGQNALVCAVFRQNEDIAAMLVEAGADPAAGTPSALETARYFQLPQMTALLQGR
ncbi:ankyrin repeat domain-containing protein [Georgenia thermotolerans]|uniref:Ankyrin repeat domain-containing protein n=1 Tax=Georgenia thermotolerans TaxID=527326 RepID=A0A7J5URP1_9MICO|nr:ankyrin repeat domain-containing protein [Georgenia thermotolerans]KAE8765048.1 ankyrin repeat domain-containing protein [Georgenia thermotolerans]